MKIAIMNPEMSMRGGICTYSNRLEKSLNKCEGIEARQFSQRIRNSPDVISIQYEPGCVNPQFLQQLIQRYEQPIIVTAHHMGLLNQFYPLLDGIVIHNKSQIEGMDEPWSYKIIPHPALVFPEKNKKGLRKKFGLPEDKKIIGTAGFIAGTGKKLPNVASYILDKLKDDEFVYFATSAWKGGDFGFRGEIESIAKKTGSEDKFRIDTDFVDEEILNEKMQACDLLFTWNKFDVPGSTSGIGADILGSRRKLIVKDSPHYRFLGEIDGVEVGRPRLEEFIDDVLKLLRKGDLDKNIPDPMPYSWETLVKEYVDYFREILGE